VLLITICNGFPIRKVIHIMAVSFNNMIMFFVTISTCLFHSTSYIPITIYRRAVINMIIVINLFY
jgi:hypothetical protein